MSLPVELRLPTNLDHQLVAFYRAWDRLERTVCHGSIIDFDLAEPADVPSFESREAVIAELMRLLTVVNGGSSPALKFVHARLSASASYLNALQDSVQIPLREYVRATMGIEPAPIPEARIETSRTILRRLLADKDLLDQLHLTRAIPFSRQGLEMFQEAFQTKSGENLKSQFEYFRDKWLRYLCDVIGSELDASSIAVEFAEEDAYWKNWISGNIAENEPITLRINVHERHVWYQGAVEILVLHEYCGHAVQMALWQEAVRREDIAGFFGVLTVHFPDQFLLEGLAESIAYILPDEKKRLERRSEVIRELHTYNLLVFNNIHIIANNKGLDAARLYAKQQLPFTSAETIERELKDRTSHPLFRAYQYVYAPAKEAFVAALAGVAPPKRWSLLRALYRTPMMPTDVMERLATARSLAD